MPPTHRIRCYACNCTFQFRYVKKHEETFKHLQNVDEIERENSCEEYLQKYF